MRSSFLAFILFAAATLAPALALAQPKIESLAFLAGHWRGTNATGLVADEIYSAPEGGMMVGVAREFAADGKCVFYDLEVFAETADGIVFSPHPMGRKSARTFPLVAAECTAKKVVFENSEHDFPRRFVWELSEAGELRITLTGLRKGAEAKETYVLKRVP